MQTRYYCRIILPCIAILSAALALSTMAADGQPAAAPAATPAPSEQPPDVAAPRKPAVMVRTIAFKLKDGRMVAGRIVSDDRGQVTVGELVAGRIIPNSYSRMDMEARSIKYQNVSEYQYWMATGQYFESRTWDWQDDADEFAQALRCYQTAQDLATTGSGKEGKATQDAEDRVKKILESRQRWIETTKPRAEMAALELRSTLVQRLDKIDKSLLELQSNIKDLNQWHRDYDESLNAYEMTTNARLDRLSDEIGIIRSGMYTQPRTIVTPSPKPAPTK